MEDRIEIDPNQPIEMDDKRNEIIENCFIEIDIASKIYALFYSNQTTKDDFELMQSSLAMLMTAHKITHQLYNIDIAKFKIPNGFTLSSGEVTDDIYALSTLERNNYIINMLINSISVLREIERSGWFNDDFMDNSNLLFVPQVITSVIYRKFEEISLRLANVLTNNDQN